MEDGVLSGLRAFMWLLSMSHGWLAGWLAGWLGELLM